MKSQRAGHGARRTHTHAHASTPDGPVVEMSDIGAVDVIHVQPAISRACRRAAIPRPAVAALTRDDQHERQDLDAEEGQTASCCRIKSRGTRCRASPRRRARIWAPSPCTRGTSSRKLITTSRFWSAPAAADDNHRCALIGASGPAKDKAPALPRSSGRPKRVARHQQRQQQTRRLH